MRVALRKALEPSSRSQSQQHRAQQGIWRHTCTLVRDLEPGRRQGRRHQAANWQAEQTSSHLQPAFPHGCPASATLSGPLFCLINKYCCPRQSKA